MKSTSYNFDTLAVHIDQEHNAEKGAVVIPITLSTTFEKKYPNIHEGFEYARTDNPTRQKLEKSVADLEKGKWGLAFSSGSATLSTICQLFETGDHILVIDDVYGGTHRYFSQVLVKSGIEFNFSDMMHAETFEKEIRPSTKMVWIEIPTNPLLKICPLTEIIEVSKKHQLLVVVDNTFMSPYNLNPLTLGADIVVHSATKYLNGHSDVVMGLAIGNDLGIYERLKFLQNASGMTPSPFDCYLLMRGIKTLSVRIKAHNENAIRVAEFLEKHPNVERVIYPGLPSHPQHSRAIQLFEKGYGGIVSFFIRGDLSKTIEFFQNLSLIVLASSLGGVESLCNHPAFLTHSAVPRDIRLKMGITDNLVRLSVGIEHIDDIINDLKQALDRISTQTSAQ